MGLARYRAKRDFTKTPEPRGGEARVDERGGRFVVHKHDATRLHYDFRLELKGVLVSWAVPKGPSLDPADKRLAVHVEDHPLSYATFEGVIPEREYGAGPVIVWDRGEWTPKGDPRRGLAKGHLSFTLAGAKLRGGWGLIRMAPRGESRENWLLVKESDDEARTGSAASITTLRPESAASGRDLDDVRRGVPAASRRASRATSDVTPRATRSPAAPPPTPAARPRGRRAGAPRARPELDPGALPGAVAAPMPREFAPNLATLAAAAPDGDEWVHEIKFDGYRIVCHVEEGRARLTTRNGQDWTAKYPDISAAAARLGVRSALLDGEVVNVAADGRTDFQGLQRLHRRGAPAQPPGSAGAGQLRYYMFDPPYLDGWNLEQTPLRLRKTLLAQLLRDAPGPLLYSKHVQGNGPRFFVEACRLKLEGIVSKRADGAYQRRRSKDWRKVRCGARQEFVLGGYVPHAADPRGVGSLLLGVYEGDELRYTGRVGTGFGETTRRELKRRLDALVRASSPFGRGRDVPTPPGLRWATPTLVAEVAFTEWTAEGSLRHPSFLALREDKRPKDVTAERRPAEPPERSPPPKTEAGVRPQGTRPAAKASATQPALGRLTHPDRVLWPESGTTKRDLATYYDRVASRMLPHVVGRPLMLVRCPRGRGQPCFVQKHVDARAPTSIHPVAIVEGGELQHCITIDDGAGLTALVQLGALEIHGWGAPAEDVERPDRVVFDFDPAPDVPFPRVVEATRLLRARLRPLGLACFPMTTGGKGMHVHVPLERSHAWGQVKEFAREIAVGFERSAPDRYVSTASKAKRGGRIFVDWLRNGRGATAVAPYSSRARDGATVATPLAWGEVTPRLRPESFTVVSVPRRLEGPDPWKGYASRRQRLPDGVSLRDPRTDGRGPEAPRVQRKR